MYGILEILNAIFGWFPPPETISPEAAINSLWACITGPGMYLYDIHPAAVAVVVVPLLYLTIKDAAEEERTGKSKDEDEITGFTLVLVAYLVIGVVMEGHYIWATLMVLGIIYQAFENKKKEAEKKDTVEKTTEMDELFQTPVKNAMLCQKCNQYYTGNQYYNCPVCGTSMIHYDVPK